MNEEKVLKNGKGNKMRVDEKLVTKVVEQAVEIFRMVSIGSTPPMFAEGVDVSAVIRLTLKMSKHSELTTTANKYAELFKACESLIHNIVEFNDYQADVDYIKGLVEHKTSIDIGDTVKIIKNIDESNPINSLYIGKMGVVIDVNQNIPSPISVCVETLGIDSFWPEELEVVKSIGALPDAECLSIAINLLGKRELEEYIEKTAE